MRIKVNSVSSEHFGFFTNSHGRMSALVIWMIRTRFGVNGNSYVEQSLIKAD